jgi:uncharacterized Zn-binding protein involved in type VI secretion
MGQPAARVGDTTMHGGTITGPGAPNVMIGGMPAARVGDMHVCPMLNPGVPPPPHVGGPIQLGSMTVKIGGMQAARQGDMCVCSGPPDSIAMGCPTVLIGDGAGGGGGSGGGGTAKKAAGKGTEGAVDEGHYLDVTFVDKGGFPIGGVGYEMKDPDGAVTKGAVAGQLRRQGVKQGNFDITLQAIYSAKWSKDAAKVGDKIKLTAKTSGIPSGEKATCEVFVRDSNYADQLLETLETTVDNDAIEVEWTFQVDEKYIKIQTDKEKTPRYSAPAFYFIVRSAGVQSRSGLLRIEDFIELKLKDDQGNPMANKKFRLYLSNGEIRDGQLDGSGYAKVEKIPPGNVRVSFDVKS